MSREADLDAVRLSPPSKIPEHLRCEDEFHHIDAGFVNERLCHQAISLGGRKWVINQSVSEDLPIHKFHNRHILVTALLDCCEAYGAPTLLEAINVGRPRHVFRSTERLAACPEVYDAVRVKHDVLLDVEPPKPVRIAYHTHHIVADTGKLRLALGHRDGGVNSIVGRLHDRGSEFEIEPLVIGAPWFEHFRNRDPDGHLMWLGHEFGEILPEDIEEFARLTDVPRPALDEWEPVMQRQSEESVKRAFCELLGEIPKSDWGGENNDHYSGNLTVRGRRRTGAFLLKGPSTYREMTLARIGHRFLISSRRSCE